MTSVNVASHPAQEWDSPVDGHWVPIMSRSARRGVADVAIVLTAVVATGVGLSAWFVGGDRSAQDPATAQAGRAPSRSCEPPPRTALVPEDGAWLGASIDWEHHTLSEFADRVGHAPAVAVTFADVPLLEEDLAEVDAAAAQAGDAGSMLLLTLEPHGGLDTVTRPVTRGLAERVDGYTRDGVPVLIRFGHEMNGSWYAWSQDPRGYVRAFRLLARAVHAHAPGAAMMWAPNYGGGYPFPGGEHRAPEGSPRARLLDTDGDGQVTGRDDPYAPYWPGREFVDWVGMSVYHWGRSYPWGENEVPEPGKFVDFLRGTYDGPVGDERAVPDFYREYGERERKPVAVTETAALYVPGNGGASERSVKQRWWRQAFAADLHERLPWLRMINWFEWRKRETEVGAVVDWTVTRDDAIRDRFVADLPEWARAAEDVPRC